MSSVDVTVMTIALLSFLVFLVIHSLISRYGKANQGIMRSFSLVYAGVGIGCIWSSLFLINISKPLELFFITFLLYSLLVFVYFVGIFGIMATSIRMRILTEIASYGSRGVLLSQLLKTYNVKIIIRQRLKRFVTSGDVVYEQGKYRINKHFQLFYLPALALALLWKLYGENE